MPTTCACGCGGTIEWKRHHKYRPPQFLPHHQMLSGTHAEARKRRRQQPPPDRVPSGTCECGCGGATPIAKQSGRGVYFGHPLRYIHGHNPRGKRAHGWKGGRIQNRRGYWLVWVPAKRKYAFEHRVVWEQANGRKLRRDEDIHHIDGDKSNNAPSNLMAMSHGEHTRLHERARQSKAA